MKQVFLVAAALAAGFLGGILGSRVSRVSEKPRTEQVVRARSFELVDEAGRAISYWGVDKGDNAVLAFSSHWDDAPPKGGGPSDHAPGRLQDPDNQRIVMGVIADSPFLVLRGADGKTRVHLMLSVFGRPVLAMEDETGPRVRLGNLHSDTPSAEDIDGWTLSFYPETVDLGMYTKKAGAAKYYRGHVTVNKDWVKHP